MKILTISNLYPRPDNPTLGMFNAQLFREMEAQLRRCPVSPTAQNSELRTQNSQLTNICIVPEWRVCRWSSIRRWMAPDTGKAVSTRYLPVFYLPVVGRNWSGWTYERSLGQVLDSIGQSDVVYSTWLYPDGVAVANAAASVGVASWIMVMGSDTFHLQVPARRRAILDACEKAEGLICVCRTLANRLIEAGVAAGKVHVVPNGVDSSVFHHRDKERAANELPSEVTDPKWLCPVLDGSAQLVLFVANLVPVKAPDVMIESFVELQDALGSMRDHKPVHLLFIGDGPMRSKIQAEVRNGGLEENVHFIGKRPHKEVALWMNVADCLCLCSSNEGMPNAVLEALASGLPVAATDVGACREMLEQEQYGRVSPVNDPGAMASLLGEILNMDTDRATMAARHGKRDWSDQAMDILSLLGE